MKNKKYLEYFILLIDNYKLRYFYELFKIMSLQTIIKNKDLN